MTIHKILVETLTQRFQIDLPCGVEVIKHEHIFTDGSVHTWYEGLEGILVIAGKHPRYITFVDMDTILAVF